MRVNGEKTPHLAFLTRPPNLELHSPPFGEETRQFVVSFDVRPISIYERQMVFNLSHFNHESYKKHLFRNTSPDKTPRAGHS